MKILLLVFFSVLSFNSSAVIESEGVVKRVKTFSNNPDTYSTTSLGLVVVYVDELAGACESGERRIAIGETHPLSDTVLSIALVSKTTGKKVKIGHTGTCSLRGNAWDFGSIELLE